MKGFKVKSGISLKRKVVTEEQQNAKLKEAAKMYEKQFLREIMKAMRNTVKHSEMSKPGFGEKIYQNQLDNEYVEKWGDSGGIGLSNLIYEQIKERFGMSKNLNKPKGPIPIDKKPVFLKNLDKSNMMRLKNSKGSDDLSFIVPYEKTNTNEVANPWSGKVKNNYTNNLKQVIEIEHDIGLTSLLSFSGELDQKVSKGSYLQEGSILGQINSADSNLYWKLMT